MEKYIYFLPKSNKKRYKSKRDSDTEGKKHTHLSPRVSPVTDWGPVQGEPCILRCGTRGTRD